jgi:hypothetical protein
MLSAHMLSVGEDIFCRLRLVACASRKEPGALCTPGLLFLYYIVSCYTFHLTIFRKIENLTFILNLITQLAPPYLRADTQHS